VLVSLSNYAGHDADDDADDSSFTAQYLDIDFIRPTSTHQSFHQSPHFTLFIESTAYTTLFDSSSLVKSSESTQPGDEDGCRDSDKDRKELISD